MSTIYALQAREILDGRGWPTVELVLWLDNGFSTITSVPTPVSHSDLDSTELRDRDERMLGLGVQKAIDNINQIIAPQLIGKDVLKQREIDQLLLSLDGTSKKNKLGANAILAVSQVILKAGALSVGLPLYQYVQKKYKLTTEATLPTCIVTALDGGVHGGKNLDFREFFLIPASHIPTRQAIEMSVTIKQKLEELLISKGAIHSVGITGGFSPNLYKNLDAFELLLEAIRTTNYNFAQDIFFGVNAAAQDTYEAGKYRLRDNNEGFNSADLLTFYKKMREQYKIIYLEDPFIDSDKKQWQELTAELGSTTTIAACNHLSSRVSLVNKGFSNHEFNSIVIKPKQLGTISETMETIKFAKDHQLNIVISHSSGETLDTFIVDFAVGVGANAVKFGPINRGERIAKYNRLLEIERELKSP
jgi:enolase